MQSAEKQQAKSILRNPKADSHCRAFLFIPHPNIAFLQRPRQDERLCSGKVATSFLVLAMC
jgi:hypothetical protein